MGKFRKLLGLEKEAPPAPPAPPEPKVEEPTYEPEPELEEEVSTDEESE